MTVIKKNLILASAISLVLAGCGGATSEPEVTDTEASVSLQESATEASDVVEASTADATEAVEETAAEAGSVLEQAADSSAAAIDSATDTVTDAASSGWNDLQNNWQDSIASIKDRWADLSEEELMSVNGDREALVTLVQDKYGLDRATAESEVNDWASSL
ncbi:hypothetical protein ACUNV4_18265 [Granulosicoccus sp. 3-233]|uniref:hypothetical protein n=1 Tax=Granulosicoccus sp. 3-233 TaxID=3417969 RepID=UPI003D342BEE